MGKNYSVEDILAEIKHKKEQEHPAAASAGRADELVEEILMERETAKKHHREIAQETRMFPGMDKKTPAGIAEGAESSPPAEGEGAPEQSLPVPDVRNALPEKQPEGKRPVYESVKSRNPAGYFTRSFRRVDPSGKVDRAENDGEMRLERASRERMQARLQAKVGLTFTQQLSGEPGKSKYGIVGGEQKLAQAQEQNHQVKKAVRQSVTEAFERAAAAGTPIFRDTAPLLFDTKSSLKINLPEKKEEPKQEQEKIPGTPQPVQEENNLQAQAEADGQPFEVSEEVLSMHEELSKKREEKVKKFHLFDTEEPDEEEEEPAPKQESIEDFENYEDAESVQNDLNYTRFKVVFRLGIVAVLTVLSLYIGLSPRFSLPIPSAVSAAGDPFLFLLINFGL